MSSRTKRAVPAKTIEAIVARALGPGTAVAGIRELDEGLFNTAYRVSCRGAAGCDRDVVVKIAPSPGTPLLTHEHDIMRTEALFYERATERVRERLPKLIAADFRREVLDRDYLVLSALEGASWQSLGRRVPRRDRPGLRRELGRWVAALHEIAGPRFGYPQRFDAHPGDDWHACFLAMVEDVCRDADRYGVRLPARGEAILDAVRDGRDAFVAVTTPALVHFDLWNGNLFLRRRDGRLELEGVIDPERAFFGDPVAELVSLALFADVEADAALLEGYREAGGAIDFTAEVRHRLTCYRAYLDLIMIVEGAPRHARSLRDRAIRGYVRARLRQELSRLGVA